MMRKAMATTLMAAAAMLAGCGEAKGQGGGPTVERAYQVGAFDRIEVAGHYDVEVRTGAAPGVSASGPQREIERLVVEVRGNTLHIHPEKRSGLNRNWSSSGPVRLAVTVPAIAAASIAGSGDMSIDRVAGESFEGGIAGSGDLRLGQVEVRRLKMGIAGSGEFRAQGRAESAAYEIAGSGDIFADGLAAQTANVSIAGSGNVQAHASQTASVEIAGSDDVRLKGGARCSISKAGSGNVECS